MQQLAILPLGFRLPFSPIFCPTHCPSAYAYAHGQRIGLPRVSTLPRSGPGTGSDRPGVGCRSVPHGITGRLISPLIKMTYGHRRCQAGRSSVRAASAVWPPPPPPRGSGGGDGGGRGLSFCGSVKGSHGSRRLLLRRRETELARLRLVFSYVWLTLILKMLHRLIKN